MRDHETTRLQWLLRECWTSLAHPGFLLERMRHLQYPEIVAIAAHDLQPDRQRQLVIGESRGHGDRRMARGRDVVRALHPVDIARELHAVDGVDVWLANGERRHLVYRQAQEFVAL